MRAPAEKSWAEMVPADDFVGGVFRQVQTRNPVAPSDRLAGRYVRRRSTIPVFGEHLRSERVDEDLAVGVAVADDLPHEALERGFDPIEIGATIVGSEIEDGEMAAGDDLAKHGLTATDAVLAEPAAARLHVPRLDDGGVGKMLPNRLGHPQRVAKVGILQAGSRQHGITHEEEILVADGILPPEILAVGDPVTQFVEVRGT